MSYDRMSMWRSTAIACCLCMLAAVLLTPAVVQAGTAWSEEVTVVTPRDYTSPAAPTGLTVNQGNLSLILDWDDNAEDDLCYYSVYRSPSAGVSIGGTPIATTTESAYTDEGLTLGERYYYVVTATDLSDCQDPPLPDPNPQSGASNEVNDIVIEIPFEGADIGGATPAGSFSGDGCPMTVTGGGGDIWGSSDQFYYVYQPAAGDTEMETKILSQQNTNDWAKAGVMFRETLDAGSKHAFMAITPSNGAAFQRRTSTGGTSDNTQASATAPLCLKLVRSGNTFTGFISTNDGDTWTEAGNATIDMASNYYIGYAVTSHSQGTGSTVEFDCCGPQCPDKAPAAPSDLAITDSSATTCSLSWTDNSGADCDQADSFTVERSTDGGVYEVADTVTSTSYIDSGLAYGSSYDYRVYASNSFGDSSASNVVNLPARVPDPPAAPTGLAASAAAGKVSLAWDANTETDPAVLYYIVYRSTTQGGPYSPVAVAFGGTNIVDSQVYNDVTYYYVIKAVDVFPQQSSDSGEVQATPHESQIPAAPSNLVATTVDHQQIDLSWTDNSDNEDGFRVYRDGDMAGETTGTTYNDTGLQASTTYNYKVVAYNVDGESAEPNPTDSATTDSIPAPNAPSDLVATAVSGSQIDLTWTDNSDNEDNFIVYRNSEIAGTPTAASFSDTGLNPLTTYSYTVTAVNAGGESAAAGPVSETTLGGTIIEDYVDDADASITYTGTWGAQTGWGGRYLTTIHESDDSGTPAAAEMEFTGVEISLIADTQPYAGSIDVYIDDQLELDNVSLNAATAYQVEIFKLTVPNGTHTVKIEHAGGGWVYIDALVVGYY